MNATPVSIIFALVRSREDGRYSIEYEIVWSDGTVRSLTVDPHKPTRIDFDQLYLRPSLPPKL